MNAGLVHFWNDAKGYGFIRRKIGGADLFFHHSELPRSKGRQTIEVGTLVEFELGEFRGQPCARSVQPLVSVEPDGGNEHGQE
jgi:CspA family cold shock protein